MNIRWLGWAGVEIEEQGEHVVIDPLADAGAVFSWLGEKADGLPRPAITAPRPGAIAGLVTHLHRDHADAGALQAALTTDAPVYEPESYGGARVEQLAVIQADTEMTNAGLHRRPTPAWMAETVGPFTITALPAVDGTGDPQVSWLIEAGDTRVLHLGDTMYHAWWWRFRERFGAPDVLLAPVNGARLTFPHRVPASPLPGALDPEQAALAGEILKAEQLVPIHYDGYDVPGVYQPVEDTLTRLHAASTRVTTVDLGDTIAI